MPNSTSTSVLNKYPFDPHGVNNQNIVENERQIVTVKNGYDFHYLIPDYAPFFAKDFKMYIVTQKGAKQYLTLGVDYVFSYRFIEAIVSTGNPIFGAISFINQNFSGEVWIEYRTVGGDWNVPKQKIQEIITNTRYNPRTATWDQVANLPYQFPPTNHTHHTKDLTEFKDVVDAVNKIVDALNRKANNPDIEIIINKVLARITKKDVGLGDVENLPLLPPGQGNDNSDNYYTTPRSVREIIDGVIGAKLSNINTAITNIRNMSANDFNAYTREQTDALLNKRLGKNETAADSTKLSNKTYDQVEETILSKAKRLTVDNSVKFDNLTSTEFINKILSMRINATTLEGDTKEQIINDARTNVNAVYLGGKTLENIIDIINKHIPETSENARKFGGLTPSEFETDYRTKFVNMSGATKNEGRLNYIVTIGESSNSQKKQLAARIDDVDLGTFITNWPFASMRGKNLNEVGLNDAGIHDINVEDNPTKALNYPIDSTGILMILKGGPRGRQFYFPDGEPRIFTRSSTSGDREWNEWVEMGSGNILKLYKDRHTETGIHYIGDGLDKGWVSSQGPDKVLKFTKHNVVNNEIEYGLPLVEIAMPDNKTGLGHVLATTGDIDEKLSDAINQLREELFSDNGKLKESIIPPSRWA